MKYIKYILFINIFTLTGCAELLMADRTFINEMDRESEGIWTAGQDFQTVPGDSGQAFRSRDEIQKRTPASFQSSQEMLQHKSINSELESLVDALPQHERMEYEQNKDLFENKSQAIYYLRLSPGERVSWIGTLSPRSYGSRIKKVSPEFAYGRMQSNIHLGMNKDNVVHNWGRPMRVDVAGDPRNENERWSYNYAGQVRQVYFENGRVNGWSLD